MISRTILAVVRNITVHERQAAEWAKYDVGAQRVGTMHEAIVRLKSGEQFFFVVINEDCIPEFLIQLPVMRDITAFPIIVVTSTFTMEKKIIAMDHGADLYVPFSEKIEHDIHATFRVFKAQSRWANRPDNPPPVLIVGDIVLSLSRRTVLVKDTPVSLTKLEFDVLHYLMANQGHFLTHSQILLKVWGSDYQDDGSGLLRRTISRLRRKLSKISPDCEYIKVEREVGYKFLT